MDALREEERYTIDYIYALPDGERAELIDGRIYDMAPPNTRHQRLLMNLSYEIENYIRQKNGGCEVLPAPFAVFLKKDETTYVEPDISVICDPDKLDEKGCHGAPDWIVEIVSPGSKQMDYFRKLLLYGEAGVREYWIVDPMKQRVMVYGFEQETVEEYTFGQEVPVGIYEGFTIVVHEE